MYAKQRMGGRSFGTNQVFIRMGFKELRELWILIQDVGVTSSSIILTARSGRAALKHRLELLGYQPNKSELDQLYQNFLVVADEKKNIVDDDLMTLVANTPLLVTHK